MSPLADVIMAGVRDETLLFGFGSSIATIFRFNVILLCLLSLVVDSKIGFLSFSKLFGQETFLFLLLLVRDASLRPRIPRRTNRENVHSLEQEWHCGDYDYCNKE